MWQIPTLLVFGAVLCAYGQYEWQARDAFDEVRRAMDRVNKYNCEVQHVGDLYLPEDAVSHIPDIKDVNINPVFPNRKVILLDAFIGHRRRATHCFIIDSSGRNE